MLEIFYQFDFQILKIKAYGVLLIFNKQHLLYYFKAFEILRSYK